MLERFARSLAVALIASIGFSGCAHFTKSGRQQLAYQKYVRKCSKQRDRQWAKMKAPHIPVLPPSQDKVTTQVGGSPESVTSGESKAASDDVQLASDATP
jgi:uncharacterized protein YceK